MIWTYIKINSLLKLFYLRVALIAHYISSQTVMHTFMLLPKMQ